MIELEIVLPVMPICSLLATHCTENYYCDRKLNMFHIVAQGISIRQEKISSVVRGAKGQFLKFPLNITLAIIYYFSSMAYFYVHILPLKNSHT